mmetsp:Transcript_75751/g.190482  ORF Transcript_75751/g.190482 Transcript_75751/m.190482 type:complete len:291 (-) Transcript_75751:223-1095(-)
MDSLGDAEPSEDQDDLFTALIGLAHAVAFGLAIRWFVTRCCRRKGHAEEAHEGTATVEQLQQKKRVFTSYALWLMGGGIGIHHFYLGRILHGLVALWSLNLMGIGWFIDGFMIPFYVRNFNAKHTAPMAPYDASRRNLLCRLPLTALAIWSSVLGVGLYLPRVLHATGVVDIDRLAAQTEVNPYDMLGLGRSATLAEARAAYRKESLRWHPDRNHGCGKKCELKMSEITKAYELIKRRRAPPPPDMTWETWLQDLGSDWMHVLEVWTKDDENNGDKPGKAQARKQDNTDL